MGVSIYQHCEQLFYDRNTANKTHLNAFNVQALSYLISNLTLTFLNQLTIVIFIYKLLAPVLAIQLLASTNELRKPTEPKELLTSTGLLWFFFASLSLPLYNSALPFVHLACLKIFTTCSWSFLHTNRPTPRDVLAVLCGPEEVHVSTQRKVCFKRLVQACHSVCDIFLFWKMEILWISLPVEPLLDAFNSKKFQQAMEEEGEIDLTEFREQAAKAFLASGLTVLMLCLIGFWCFWKSFVITTWEGFFFQCKFHIVQLMFCAEVALVCFGASQASW